MTFAELVMGIETLAPAGVTKAYSGNTNILLTYVDGTKDSVDIEICTTESPGDEIIVSAVKGTVWYFSPALCHWLAMCSRLIADYREEAKKNEPY